MRILILTALALPLAACAGYTEPAPAPSEPPRDAMVRVCDAASARVHVGREATEEAGAAILADSGAEVLRWGPPNSAWTMDYRTDRVNVRYDEAQLITKITCG
ncbi:I78 family peptidase inhibitor [Qipengyuania sp. SS22]|uniref:I78 family peptidase inhibitor n=1 Tax=Qipengyuania sp. SS22 TaxID=2979461 RepID=UPI0021E5CD1D|nr:I78 family peptidase inhibitor [Qipengyuania sp. SS22]UYH54998.1 I78 family peptidase inhibitor [Qipengyuania sp. SS22]